MPRKAENLVGQKFGTRKVVAKGKSRDYAGNKTIYWKVKCVDCGYTSEVQGGSLRRGAGCSNCRKGGGPVNVAPSAPAPKKPRASTKKKTATMTLGVLRTALSALPDDTKVRINLVGKDGWSMVAIEDVNSVGGVALLVGNLPTQIEPWKNE